MLHLPVEMVVGEPPMDGLLGPTPCGVPGDGLRARLRDALAPRSPLLLAATAVVDTYLSAEEDLGRIDPAAHTGAPSATLIGAVHLLFTDHESTSLDARRLQRTGEAVISGAIATDRHARRQPAPSDHPSA
jgi:hypothetical protein